MRVFGYDALANSMRSFDIRNTSGVHRLCNKMLLYCVRFDASTQYYSSSNDDRRCVCAAFNHQFVRRPARGFFVNYSCAHLLLHSSTTRVERFFRKFDVRPALRVYVHSRANNNMISSPRGDHGRGPESKSRLSRKQLCYG